MGSSLQNQWTSSVIPCVEGRQRNSCFYGYGNKRFYFPFVEDMNVVSLVNALFLSCRPPAIFWRVWAVVVNALNAVFMTWSTTDVRNEVFKRLFPSLTNKNPSSSIVFIRLVSWVFASFPHVHPRDMFRAARHPVARFCQSYFCPRITAASCAFPALKVATIDVLFISANATAWNVFDRIFSIRVCNNSPVSKDCADGNDRKFHDAPLVSLSPVHYSNCSPLAAGV